MTNVALVTVDSLRADHVGCYGYDRNTTPTIDDLADDGALFEKTFGHACSTRPSFPTILTSTYPLMYGGYERLSENRTLVSEVHDGGDYRTGGFHSNAYLNPEFGYSRGFDHFFDSMTDPGVLARIRQKVKNNLDKDGVTYRMLASLFDTAERHAGANIGSAYLDADELTDRAIDWVRSGTGEDEFLWVHYMDVHHPYLPPAEHQRTFRDDPIGERRAIQLRRKFVESPEEITDAELDDIIDLYDAEIRFTDAEAGRLLDALDEEWGEYVVAFTADHGEEFLDHGQFSHHTTYYDEVTHVPLVIDDGQHQGRFDELIGLIDVSPTLVEYADLPQPENFLGFPIQRVFSDEWERDMILGDWSSDGKGGEPRLYSVRTDRWKFIRNEAGEELYDLESDSAERTNVIEENPDVAEEMRETVAEHEAEIDATHEDLGEVAMDDEVKERLRDLGYKE